MWHLITQVNDGIIAAQITVFGPMMGKFRRFIPFIIYALRCPIVSSTS